MAMRVLTGGNLEVGSATWALYQVAKIVLDPSNIHTCNGSEHRAPPALRQAVNSESHALVSLKDLNLL